MEKKFRKNWLLPKIKSVPPSLRKSKSLLETLVFPFPSLCPHPNQLLLWEERHDEEGETFVFISKEKKVLSSLLSRKNLLGTENVVILKFDSQK